MKNRTLLGVLFVALLAAACSKPATTNTTTNTSTTTTTTNSNTANRSTTSNTSNTSTANTSNTSSSNTSSSPSESAEGKQDFTLVNETGVEIDKVFVSPHTTNDWEEDILGRDTLPNGESVHITFPPRQKEAMWDLKIEDKQGTSVVWENLNLLEISKVTLRIENGKPIARTE